ncbi:MAG TPA: hypothetical protein VFJ85_18825 [Acidimicrobiales bacterium]|nr:hypothetical protein [Acidimicrobiales bacterium]
MGRKARRSPIAETMGMECLGRRAAVVVVALGLGACTGGRATDGGDARGAAGSSVVTTATTAALRPGEIAPGLKLVPGDDGHLPVKVRWVKAVDTAEAMAVIDGTLYVAGALISALDLRDGSELWQADNQGNGFDSDGGVRIGSDGPDVLRVFAPFNYDIRLARRTGRQLSFAHSAPGSPDPPLVDLTSGPPASFRVVPGLDETVAYRDDGSTAWKLLSSSPFVDPLPAASVGETVIVATSDQYVVVLDPVR